VAMVVEEVVERGEEFDFGGRSFAYDISGLARQAPNDSIILWIYLGMIGAEQYILR
jgi:hypothetical protein